MGKRKDLSLEEKSSVIALLRNTQYSQRDIANQCGVSQSSVRRLSQKLQANQTIGSVRRGRCGRKSIVTPRGQRFLRNIAVEHRRATHCEIKNKFVEAGYTVSVATVRRNLYSMGFKCRRPVKKPKLTPAMVKKRLTWANLHKNLSVDDWQIVSD